MDEFEAEEAARIGRLIAQRRKERDMTQQDLANLLGISISSLGRWEQGKVNSYAKNRRRLAEVLKIPAEELRPREPEFEDLNSSIDERFDALESRFDEFEKLLKDQLGYKPSPGKAKGASGRGGASREDGEPPRPSGELRRRAKGSRRSDAGPQPDENQAAED